MAPPTESAILENYLLVPGQLPAFVSLREFTAFFPKPMQSSPHVRSLYRDLQAQRGAAVDAVAAGIDAEVRRGRALRREVVRARREAEVQHHDDEVEIERALFGPNMASQTPKHSLPSVIPELEGAAEDLESAIQRLESEEVELLRSVQQTVGSMSDQRYGRLANPQLREQVLDGLKNVQETCKRKT